MFVVFKETKYKLYFIYSFLIVLLIASFLMNILSFVWLVQGRIIFGDTNLINVSFLLVFSLLAALSLTLHIYKYEKIKNAKIGKSGIGAVGFVLAFFTSACTVCYPLILTAIGIPAALAVLPFGGFELQIISILVLLASIYFVSKETTKCAVK